MDLYGDGSRDQSGYGPDGRGLRERRGDGNPIGTRPRGLPGKRCRGRGLWGRGCRSQGPGGEGCRSRSRHGHRHRCGAVGGGAGWARRLRNPVKNRFFTARFGLPMPTDSAGCGVQRGHARTNAPRPRRVTPRRIRARVPPLPASPRPGPRFERGSPLRTWLTASSAAHRPERGPYPYPSAPDPRPARRRGPRPAPASCSRTRLARPGPDVRRPVPPRARPAPQEQSAAARPGREPPHDSGPRRNV